MRKLLGMSGFSYKYDRNWPASVMNWRAILPFLRRMPSCKKIFFKKFLPFICTKPPKKRWKIEGTFFLPGNERPTHPFSEQHYGAIAWWFIREWSSDPQRTLKTEHTFAGHIPAVARKGSGLAPTGRGNSRSPSQRAAPCGCSTR